NIRTVPEWSPSSMITSPTWMPMLSSMRLSCGTCHYLRRARVGVCQSAGRHSTGYSSSQASIARSYMLHKSVSRYAVRGIALQLRALCSDHPVDDPSFDEVAQ